MLQKESTEGEKSEQEVTLCCRSRRCFIWFHCAIREVLKQFLVFDKHHISFVPWLWFCPNSKFHIELIFVSVFPFVLPSHSTSVYFNLVLTTRVSCSPPTQCVVVTQTPQDCLYLPPRAAIRISAFFSVSFWYISHIPMTIHPHTYPHTNTHIHTQT